MKIHEFYINRCLELAENGRGNTYPNPSVGCVIVYQDRIIGEGFTSKAGGPHAEVNAVHAVSDPELLKESTLYVTLEPCSHFGKTPPCADLISEMKIPRVVIGTLDSNKEVSGRGVKKLMENGCEVIVGVLEEACRESNKRFFCFHENKRPYIILKWAESADGYLAPAPEVRDQQKAAPVWLSDKPSRQLVHKWRSEEQAILCGTGTALADNPSLTTRDWHGSTPLRIYIDRKAQLPVHANLLDGSTPTVVFTEAVNPYPDKKIKDLEIITIIPEMSLPKQIMALLYQKNIQSLIVEGGAKTLTAFIDEGLWDEARVFKAPVTLGSGIAAPETGIPGTATFKVGQDQLVIYRNSEQNPTP